MREGTEREEERHGTGRPEAGPAEAGRAEADPRRFPFSIEEEPPPAERPGAEEELPLAERPGRSEATEVPLILPGGRRAASRRRHRETLLWAFAFLAASGVLGWALIAPVGEGPSDSAEFRAATLPGSDGASREDAAAAFSDAAAAFSDAASAYRERARDFGLGRLDCTGLRRGFRTVEEAFAERAGGEARRAMREIERHFEASGCPVESPAP